MKTAFALIREVVGLTSPEAALYLGVSLDTVKSWNSGRNTVPLGVMEQMKDLWEKLLAMAENTIEAIDGMLEQYNSPPTYLEYGIPESDAEAQEVTGLPTVSTVERLAGIIAAETEIDIKIVQRGSTIGSQQAIYARILGESSVTEKERTITEVLALAKRLGYHTHKQFDDNWIVYVPAFAVRSNPPEQPRIKAWADTTDPHPQTIIWPLNGGVVTYIAPLELLDDPSVHRS